MHKMISLSILLCFFAIQNASALTLKKGETLGSDGQIKSSAASKGAGASDTNETVIYLAWAHWDLDKPAPTIEAVDTLIFSADGKVADSEGLVPTIKYKDMTDDYMMKGREALSIRLLNDETLSIQGRVEVFRDEFVSINNEVSLSSRGLSLPLNDIDNLVISWRVSEPVLEEWKSDCDGKTDRKVPKVTSLDCSLTQLSKRIKLPQGNAELFGPAKFRPMTVKGFPGYEQSEVYRFQSTKGACSKNSYDCRSENVVTKHVRSEASLSLKSEKNIARKGDTIVVEYDLYVPKNPNFDVITKYGDWFNFGQIHGYGNIGDVPIAVAVSRDDAQVKLVENGERTNASPIPGSLAVYLRSIVFDEVLQDPTGGGNSAIVLAGPGEFEDRWMTIRIEVQWETTKAGRIDIRLDGQQVFECSNCVTMPVHKWVALRDGKKGRQQFNFQFGIYSWRYPDAAYLYADTEPPTVVAYYKNVSWEKK